MLGDPYHFDRSLIRHITPEQWAGVQAVFSDKWVGMRVTPEDISSGAHITRGASLAILTVLHTEGAVDLRLSVYHSCRAKPVSHMSWGRGFPTYPWICPACMDKLTGRPHLVVEDLRYGIVGRMLRTVIF